MASTRTRKKRGATPGPRLACSCSCPSRRTTARSREADMAKAKYDTDELNKLLAKGHAIKNANGDPSYPIEDEEDLDKAIRAVGRGGSDHDAIRKHIIKRA